MKRKFIILFILLLFVFCQPVLADENESSSTFNPLKIDNYDDYYKHIDACNADGSKCLDDIAFRFYTKMYDIYYLYLTKYDVKLDLPLLMSTLSFNSNTNEDVFSHNLSSYDRKYIVENDWNPPEVTELDWDYDYESKDNYLVSNDNSLDMQILAKHMVSKTEKQSCVKDGTVVSSKEVADDEEDLECGDGEELQVSNASYKLDLDKYDDFLLEYLENKNYLNRNTATPFDIFTLGELYVSDKTPSIIKRKSQKKNSSSLNFSSSNEIVDKLTSIALGEVGNGPTKYQTFMQFGSNVDWCAAFVSWLFNEVGGLDKLIVRSGGAGSIPRDSIATGLGGEWFEDECSDSSTVPQAGDIIVFNPKVNGSYTPFPANYRDKYYSSHVGYVYKVDDENVYTVEGNSGGMVKSKQYSRKYCGQAGVQGINGYYRPDYNKFLDSNNIKSDNDSDTGKSDNDSENLPSETIITRAGGFKGKIHYYNQKDYSAYPFSVYGSISSHGCGPTSLAIVISSLLDEPHDPVEVTKKLCELYGCTNKGATLKGITDTAEAFGMNVNYTYKLDEVRNALMSGDALVVAITNGGLIISGGVQLSRGGHYIVLSGIDSNGQINILDPQNPSNNSRTLDLEKLSVNSHNVPSAPSFWIVTK